MEKPVDFIVAGVQKGGTTALHAYLADHPQICMAACKEIHFFDNDAHFKSGPPDYAWYHAHFSPKHASQLLGEATPAYMYWQDAPRRIWEYNPRLKLILILRNPIARAFSQWNMLRDRGTEPLSFHDAILQEETRCRNALPLQSKPFSYVDRGYYVEQLRRIRRFFPKQQTLILRHEDFRERPGLALDQICDFLGLERFTPTQARHEHVIAYASPISASDWSHLRDIFEYEIKNLERLLEWDCSDWLKQPSTVKND